MRIIKTYITILVFLISLIISGKGQNNISLETNVDSTLIGLDIPVNIKINNINIIDSLQLQVLNFKELTNIYKPKIDTANYISQSKSSVEEIQKTDFEISDFGNWKGRDFTIIPKNSRSNIVKIKVWDTGQFTILPVRITVNKDTIYPINPEIYPVVSVFAGINPKDTLKSIAPLKDIIKEKKTWKDYIWIYTAIIVFLLIILVIVFLPRLFINKKTTKKYKNTIKKKVIPAHLIALEKLNKLKKEEIWKQGKVKEFQSQLTFILREYLENRYNIRALEQTTGEILQSLYNIDMDNKDIDIIKNILQIADMVKFAKAKPGEDIHKKFLNETIEFVLKTKQEVTDNDGKH